MRRLFAVAGSSLVVVFASGSTPALAASPPQGYQSDAAYASSFTKAGVFNTIATTQRTSCFTPEVPYFLNNGPAEGYSGMSECGAAATTGEDVGPYPTQAGSNPGYPAASPMLVKNHAESNVVVDPLNAKHLIGSSKWFVSAEGYNHELGFYESWDGGQTWPVQGHIPGYEGWTDNTDPVGAFDGFGNYYEFVLAYQFFYDPSGAHDFQTNPNLTPNRSQPAEVVGVAVRPHGSTSAREWSTNRSPDIIASYPMKGQEPDKQWIAIDSNPSSPFYNTIYAMWVVFDGFNSKPYYSTAHANADGTHTAWSAPTILPTTNATASDTYLIPQVAPDGTVYTVVSNFPSGDQRSLTTTYLDYSADGGASFQGPLTVTPTANTVLPPYCCYSNTNTRSGITDTFAIGPGRNGAGKYPLYVAWEDYSTGYAKIYITASNDGGNTWSNGTLVNDNLNPNVDEFQPNLAVAAGGTVGVAFYDRRLACPATGSKAAAVAGLALDTNNPHYSATPPYGAANYCANTSIQFYSGSLAPIGHNVRLSRYSFDPELNSDLYACGCSIARGFIGDYFGNTAAGAAFLTSSVTTIDDGTNGSHFQQQLIAMIAAP